MFRKFKVKDIFEDDIIQEFKNAETRDEIKEEDNNEEEQKSTKPSLDENAYFESYLAITLAKRKDLFPIVDKMSSFIIWSIDRYRDYYRHKLKSEKLCREVFWSLYSDDFGVLGDLYNEKKTPDDMLNDIKFALLDKNKLLTTIIPIQFIFNFRIHSTVRFDKYDKILSEPGFMKASTYLKETKKHVHHKPLKDFKPTKQIGLSRDPEVCKRINAIPETAEVIKDAIKLDYIRNSFEKFTVNQGDNLHKFTMNNAPVVAGPSTHTYIALAAAKTLSSGFTDEELREYAFAYFIFTGCAGYHTFHEVMAVTSKCLNLPYDMTNYIDNLPKTLRESSYIEELKKEFPDQLRPATQVYTGKPDPALLSSTTEDKKPTPRRVRFEEPKKEAAEQWHPPTRVYTRRNAITEFFAPKEDKKPTPQRDSGDPKKVEVIGRFTVIL